MRSRVTHDCVRKRRIESRIWIEHIIIIHTQPAHLGEVCASLRTGLGPHLFVLRDLISYQMPVDCKEFVKVNAIKIIPL